MRSMPPFRFFPATTSAFPSATSDVTSISTSSRATLAQSSLHKNRNASAAIVSSFCGATFIFATQKTFSRHLRLQSAGEALRSDFATTGDVDDDVDHIEADAFVSGSRCLFGQRSLPRIIATRIVSQKDR
jgi:hypothetical protein